MSFIGSTTSIHNVVIKEKAASTLIRIVDAQYQEEECIKTKMPEHWNQIDLEARNTFHEGVGVGTLKHVIGHNEYGYRNEKTTTDQQKTGAQGAMKL